MRKSTGFTLAEVLITLSIIGIVAALTIPSLVRDFQDAQNRAAFKRVYSELSQVMLRYREDNGGNWAFLAGKANYDIMDDLEQTPYIGVTRSCGGSDRANCWHSSTANNDIINLQGVTTSSGADDTLIMKNGMLLGLSGAIDYSCPLDGSNGYCARFLVDVNGFKGPNQIGRDIFYMYLTDGGLRPAGIAGFSYPNNCGGTTSGWGCAQWVLTGQDY